MQDPHVLPRRPLGPLLTQQVIRQAEPAARKQVRLVTVVDERPRLADQPVDDVPVVDAMLAAASQPRQLLDPPLAVPDLDPLGIQPRFDPLADQPAGHRVDVPLHADRAARFHPYPQPLARLQTADRQRSQHRQLLGETSLPTGVALVEHLPQKCLVGIPAGEVAAAPQQQGLVQTPLELTVALLTVAVLVALAGIDGLPLQAIVVQDRLVASLEHGPVRSRLHGRRQPIRAMPLGDPAELPQGVLQALAEALQALGKTDRSRLPIRVGQDKVIDQVLKGAAGDGHAQLRAVREVAGGQPARVMHLGEEDLLGRSRDGPPVLEPPLQGAELPLGETARKTALQILEHRLGLQAGALGQ